MHCLMQIDFGDVDQRVALPIAMVAIEDLLLIHGCDSKHLGQFTKELESWMAPQAIRTLELFGAAETLEVAVVDRRGQASSRRFRGKGCALNPAP